MGLSQLGNGFRASSYQNINVSNLSALADGMSEVAGSCGGEVTVIIGRTLADGNLWPGLCPWLSGDPSQKTGSDLGVSQPSPETKGKGGMAGAVSLVVLWIPETWHRGPPWSLLMDYLTACQHRTLALVVRGRASVKRAQC